MIIHRDIAARNVLVTGGDILKIADFGMTRECNMSDHYRPTGTKHVPVKWLAPEFTELNVYGFKLDAWSYSVVMWEIFELGTEPYPGMTPEQTIRCVSEGYHMGYPHGTPPEICDIKWYCWCPTCRLSFSQLPSMV